MVYFLFQNGGYFLDNFYKNGLFSDTLYCLLATFFFLHYFFLPHQKINAQLFYYKILHYNEVLQISLSNLIIDLTLYVETYLKCCHVSSFFFFQNYHNGNEEYSADFYFSYKTAH